MKSLSKLLGLSACHFLACFFILSLLSLFHFEWEIKAFKKLIALSLVAVLSCQMVTWWLNHISTDFLNKDKLTAPRKKFPEQQAMFYRLPFMTFLFVGGCFIYYLLSFLPRMDSFSAPWLFITASFLTTSLRFAIEKLFRAAEQSSEEQAERCTLLSDKNLPEGRN